MLCRVGTLLVLWVHIASALWASDFKSIAECKHWVSNAALEGCLEAAQDFALKNKTDLEALDKAARYIAEFDQAGSARVYQLMVDKLGPSEGCQRPGVSAAAMQALRSKNDFVGKAGAAIAQVCVDSMAEDLKRTLSENQEHFLKRTCPILRKHKSLSGLRQKKCDPYQ